MFDQAREHYARTLTELHDAGLSKDERVIVTPQGPVIGIPSEPGRPGPGQPGIPSVTEPPPQRDVLNFCANNYLGLSSHPAIIQAAHRALDERGYGLSSVRFICGTQDHHKQLEQKLSAFLGTDDTILYGSAFDANGGLFETLLGPEDAVISDALNHASVIDGIRLCKAQRLRFEHDDLADLEAKLKESQAARLRMIATDGVFSMDGDIARLAEICDLADRYRAMVMVDDSHATGFLGPTGRGTHELRGVMGRVDVITSTLGKALGGASGGLASGRREIVSLLRNRSRPYLFSNTLAPVIVGGTLAALDLISTTAALRDKLFANTRRFREAMTRNGFAIRPGEHPIVPVMLGDALLAKRFASDLLDESIYVIGFSYPVVPQGKARIRVQLSAAHSDEQVDRAVAAFTKIGCKLGVLLV